MYVIGKTNRLSIHVKLTVLLNTKTYVTCKTNCIELVLHVTYIFCIQHILFLINLKIKHFRVSFAVEYILNDCFLRYWEAVELHI